MKFLLVIAVLGLATARPENRGGFSGFAASASASSSRGFRASSSATTGSGGNVQSGYGAPDAAASAPEGNVQSGYGAPDAAASAPEGSVQSGYGAPDAAASAPEGNVQSGYGAPDAAASAPEGNVQSGYGAPDAAASGPEGNIAEAEPASYNFEYSVQDDESGTDFGQQESRDGDSTSGSYYVQMPDGRMQIVNYSVDADSGYVVDIQYEGEANVDGAASGQDGNVATPKQSYGY